MSRAQWLAAGGGAIVVILMIWGVMAFRSRSAAAANGSSLVDASGSATATIQTRDFVRALRIHGTVAALQFRSIAAPRLTGPGSGSMIITKLIPAGAHVKRGELLVEFDRQNQIKAQLDRQAEFRDFEEQIKKKKADQAAALARDTTELRQAENAVETARLEMRKNEVISKIDAEKNQQNLEEAEARLAQLKETFELKRAAARAEVRIVEIQRDRARRAMEHARLNAEKLAIRAPLDGIVVMNAVGRPGGMGEVQEGDEVRPGATFMQVVDPTSMQVRSRVNQADVPYLHIGQPVVVQLDAYPDLHLAGKIEGLAAIGVTSNMNQKVRTFAATVSIQGNDPRLLPDLSAAVDVEVERRSGVLVAPRDALISENGQTFLSVKRGMGYEKVAVKVATMSDAEVVVEPNSGAAITPGTVVARKM
ncbi:MAG TPA: HlyD family efflux transporter periplasmic adaptor subunit [Candidatus Acidoferrales bacterium]|nr:HlyD family efflux transporter periplasmic adaptor subunit [Candidatus Acidoferrales bacterium]